MSIASSTAKRSGFEVVWRPTGGLAGEVARMDEAALRQSGLIGLGCGCVIRLRPQRVVVESCEAAEPHHLAMRESSSAMFADRAAQREAAYQARALWEHVEQVRAWERRKRK